ncbi:putative uncharacterized protein [Roseburia sp. CAG:197]|jgi:tRNA G18 (ribose-2'-O)-methylase SpoU|nr:putative uncharacterized protein [Roseburia sp. CAG:197]
MKTAEMMKVIEIQNFEAPELDVYARLTENQLVNRADPAKGMFIAESPKVIMRALDAGCVPVSVLMEKRQLETEGEALEAIRMCSCTNKEFPVYVAEFEVLAKLTGFKLTRGMLCAMYRPKLRTPQEICRDARRIAVLENVVNPTNVGAIFRSAAALNMDAVLLTPACSDPLYRRAIRVSMGTVFQIPWTYIGEKAVDWPNDMGQLRQMGFQTVAMALREDSLGIDDKRLHAVDKLAILLGTEGEGLADETLAQCDYTVRIPMSHGVDSLNVAAASAVAFYELGK